MGFANESCQAKLFQNTGNTLELFKIRFFGKSLAEYLKGNSNLMCKWFLQVYFSSLVPINIKHWLGFKNFEILHKNIL